MSQPLRSATRTETPETPTLHALPAPHRPAADELTPKRSELICDIVKSEGISDASAGALIGVRGATIERWKAEHEQFAADLERARAWFEMELVREIRTARKRDGSPDWRARAWLLTHLSSEGIVKPGRASKAPPAKEEPAAAQNCAIRPETPVAPPAPPANASRENTTNLPETPARPRVPLSAAGPQPGNGIASAQNATILPETLKARPGVATV